jgi:hypothetical protein
MLILRGVVIGFVPPQSHGRPGQRAAAVSRKG